MSQILGDFSLGDPGVLAVVSPSSLLQPPARACQSERRAPVEGRPPRSWRTAARTPVAAGSVLARCQPHPPSRPAGGAAGDGLGGGAVRTSECEPDSKGSGLFRESR